MQAISWEVQCCFQQSKCPQALINLYTIENDIMFYCFVSEPLRAECSTDVRGNINCLTCGQLGTSARVIDKA